MADVISQRWGVDASEYVSESTHLIAGHPFSFLVNTYGLWHTPDAAAIRASLVEPKSALAITTVRQIPLYVLEGQAQSSGPQSAQTVWGSILQNRDTNSFDMEAIINCYVGQENCALVISELKRLQKVSPQSPVLIALEIRNNWDKDKAAEWEADHGDYPTVALALGQKYLELKQWSDAERCLGKYIAVSPDFTGYTALAQVYKSQQQDDRWVATLNEFLGQTDYGLQHATVQVQLANYYMDKGDFKSALPYADAAAGTASGWGMLCAVEAHTGTGDWSAAQQLLIDEKDHYSESPFRWYAWCVHTGHGSLDAARDAMVDYFATKGDALTNQEMLELGCFQLSRKNDAGAIKTFQRRVKNNPGPVSLLHIAIAADESHDNATRDAALEQIKTVPEHESCFGRLGFALQEAIKAGPDASPDPQAMNGILTGRGPIDSMRICALTARFLDNRNHPDEATTYLRRCIGLRGDCEDRLIIDAALRDRGIDPMAAHDTTLP
jgi:tetratricopeptide (TPR) repeat protein